MAAKIKIEISASVLLLTANACLLSFDVFPPGVIFDRKDDWFRRIPLVGEEFFDVARLKLQFQRERQSAPRAFVISAFATTQDAILLGGKGHTESDYGHWERLYYARHGHDAIRMMELIAINDNAVIRVADRGKVSRVVVSGTDPTIFQVGKRHCDLLQLTFQRLPHAIRRDGKNPVIVRVNVQTDQLPTDSEARDIMQTIRNRLRYKIVDGDIRRDN